MTTFTMDTRLLRLLRMNSISLSPIAFTLSSPEAETECCEMPPELQFRYHCTDMLLRLVDMKARTINNAPQSSNRGVCAGKASLLEFRCLRRILRCAMAISLARGNASQPRERCRQYLRSVSLERKVRSHQTPSRYPKNKPTSSQNLSSPSSYLVPKPINHHHTTTPPQTTMPPSAHWILALVELIYYTPSILPLAYTLYTHRRTGLAGWTFLLLFTILQATGAGMIVSAGPHGTPSSIAVILVQVGLSPLILGLAGAVHEYGKLTGWTKGRERLVMVANVAFHVAVVTAIAVYAVGASDSSKSPVPENAQTLYRVGVVLLLLLFVLLCAAFAVVARSRKAMRTARPLFWTIALSLGLLAIRLVYSMVSAFDQSNPAVNPVTGRIVYQAVLVFLPGALIVAIMVTGGVMTTHVDVTEHECDASAAIPLTRTQKDSDEIRDSAA